jgi:hypothetical protein
MAKVINRGPSALCLRAGDVEVDLEVGATEVDDAKLEAILAGGPSGELFDRQCECVTDDERDPNEGTKDYSGRPPSDLSKLKLAAAKLAIAACNDPAQLKAWVLTDSRKEVRKALHLRDRDLRPGDDADDEIAQDLKIRKVD